MTLGTSPDDARLVGGAEYDRALPILLVHLARPNSDHLAVVLAAALGVPGAQPFWHKLKSLYLAESRPQPRERLAFALAVSVADVDIDELIDLLRDPANGESRFYLLLAFDRRTTGYRAARRAKFAEVVEDLQLDPELNPYIEDLRWTSRPPQRASPHEVREFDAGGLAETSASFEIESLGAFFRALADLGVGFPKACAKELTAAIKRLDPDEQVHFAFDLDDDRTAPLFVIVHMDDADSPELWFFAHAEVTARISRLIEGTLGLAAN
jgi:hypothetical protein